MSDSQVTPPDPKNEDVHLETLTNALITSFLGSVVGHAEMSEAAKALEYLLNCFITGPHPPFKGWFINELAYYPLVRLRVTTLTFQDVEHKISMQVDMESIIPRPEEEDNGNAPHLS